MDQTVKTGKFLNGTEYFDTYTYDNVGNVLTEQTAYSASLDDDYTYQYTYDINGNVLTQKDALGNTARYYYNWLGNCSRATDPMGNITYYTYDKLGRKIREEQPYSEQDISDEEIITVYVDAKLYYDNNGNLITEKHANNDEWSDTTWAQTDYAYDNRDRLVKVTAYDNGSVENVTQYYYDAGGNILRMYTGLSSPLTISGLDSVSGSDTSYAVTKYTYDRFGNQLTMTDPLNKTETYTYDLNGNPLTKRDRNGVTTQYTYDSLGRLTNTAAGDQSLTYTYTFTGQKSTETTDTRILYWYDSLGRKVKEQLFVPGTDGLPATRAGGGEDGEYIEPTTYTHQYTYDIGDHRTDYVLKKNSATQVDNSYAYDAMGRMTSVTDIDSNTTRYTYNANGARSSITYPNGVVGTYTYNQVNLLEKVTYSGTDSTTKPSYAYTYYLDGNLASETKQNGECTSYIYDDLGRLTREATRTNAYGSLIQAYVYTYDDFGNRAKLTATGADAYTTTYTYNLANRLTSEAKTQSGATSTTTYTYDANGNQLKQTSPAGTTTNTYNSFNQLITSVVDGTSVSYTYTPSGLRFTKRGITYLYDGDVLALELRGTSNTHKYTYGVDLISCSVYNASSSPQTTEYYYLRNGHGDVTYLTDDDGAITKTYEYDAFGNEESPVSTDTNPFRYAGEYYDTETGTYYLRARYYDPVIGRFTQEDPHWNQSNMLYGDDPLKLNNYTYAPSLAAIIQSGNLYAYCGNNPITYVDESGNAFMLVTGAVGAIIGGIGGAIHSYSDHGEIRWKNVATGAAIGGTIGLTGGAAAGAVFAGSATASTGAVLTGISISGTAATAGAGNIVYKSLEKGVNFTKTTLSRMNNPSRFVPVQTLIDAIKNGTATPDPQGTDAIMYTIEMARNGKVYNLEVLYDKATNTILHFLYK